MARIAIVTYDPRPEVTRDRDLSLLVRELAAAGADVTTAYWDDPDVDWAGFDLAVVRSTWDYSWRAEEFAGWLERCGKVVRVANPVGVLRWNMDKRYLGELAAAGVPTVPTRYLAPGDAPDLPDDHDYVVKPTSGAGARYAARYTPEERETAVRHLARMHAEGFTAMVQPYIGSIDATGERAVQFFGGRLLHASRKGAVLAPGTAYDDDKVAHPDLEQWIPTPAELAVAERALAAVPDNSGLLYARVDLVLGDDGEPRVMELELIEPNLFLDLHPDSVPVVVQAILRAAVNR